MCFHCQELYPGHIFHKYNRECASVRTSKESIAIERSHVLACQLLLTVPETKEGALHKREVRDGEMRQPYLVRSVFMKASRQSPVYCGLVQCAFSRLPTPDSKIVKCKLRNILYAHTQADKCAPTHAHTWQTQPKHTGTQH